MSKAIPTIAVDVMGSDRGPEEIIIGIAQLLASDKSQFEIIIVGDEQIILPILKKYKLDKDSRIRAFHASEVIEMHEKPIQAMKQKKDSSMMRSIELVKKENADAVLSCGNTGAMMACGTIRLRTMEGIERPALATVIPGKDKNFILIDVGAAPDPKPESLIDNAILGINYAKVALGIKDPKVGLLSNGTEDGKGNMLVQTAHRIFKVQENVINYKGFIEGFNLFDGDVDVIVCDGFTGNVVLKSLESLFKMFKGMLKEEIYKSWVYKLGMLIARGAFLNLKKRLPVDKFAGAPLLGLNGLVVKAHGSSDRNQIEGALEITLRCLKMDMQQKIKADVLYLHDIVAKNKILAQEKEDSLQK